MTDILVRAPRRASLADAAAAATGSLFCGVCLFCAAGAFIWAMGALAGLPMIVIGAAEAVTAAVSLAIVWLLFRAGIAYAASGFQGG